MKQVSTVENKTKEVQRSPKLPRFDIKPLNKSNK